MHSVLITLPVFFICIISSLTATAKSKIEIFSQTRKSVVQIKGFETPEMHNRSFFKRGSGYIVSEDGLIVTNHHMVEDNEGLIVYIRDRDKIDTLPAFVVTENEDLDIAILKVESDNLTPLKFENPENLKQGEEILVMGYPVASAKTDDMILTWGIISSTTQDSSIQTTATINPGNSGGPAINMEGKIVGTVFAKYVGLSVEASGFLRNNKYVLQEIEKAKEELNSEDQEFFDDENEKKAYFNLCKAQAIIFGIRNTDMLEDKIEIAQDAIHIGKKAVEADGSYYRAYYFLISYYLKKALYHCENYEKRLANNTISQITPLLNEAKTLTKDKDYLEFHDGLSVIVDGIWDEEEIDCSEWRDRVDVLEEFEEEQENRFDEFMDYIRYGERPDRLAKALIEQSGFGFGGGLPNNVGVPMEVSYTNFLLNSGGIPENIALPRTQIEIGAELYPKFNVHTRFVMISDESTILAGHIGGIEIGATASFFHVSFNVQGKDNIYLMPSIRAGFHFNKPTSYDYTDYTIKFEVIKYQDIDNDPYSDNNGVYDVTGVMFGFRQRVYEHFSFTAGLIVINPDRSMFNIGMNYRF